MDVDVLLKRLLDACEEFIQVDDESCVLGAVSVARRIVEDVDTLDEHMRRGGYLPNRWSRAGAERHP